MLDSSGPIPVTRLCFPNLDVVASLYELFLHFIHGRRKAFHIFVDSGPRPLVVFVVNEIRPPRTDMLPIDDALELRLPLKVPDRPRRFQELELQIPSSFLLAGKPDALNDRGFVAELESPDIADRKA